MDKKQKSTLKVLDFLQEQEPTSDAPANVAPPPKLSTGKSTTTPNKSKIIDRLLADLEERMPADKARLAQGTGKRLPVDDEERPEDMVPVVPAEMG